MAVEDEIELVGRNTQFVVTVQIAERFGKRIMSKSEPASLLVCFIKRKIYYPGSCYDFRILQF